MTLPYSTRLTVPLAISPTAILELAVLTLAFRLAHLLHDDLLGVLRRHPAEIRAAASGSAIRSPILASGLRRLALASVICVESFSTVFDHLQYARKLGLARLWVDLAANVVLGAIAGLGRLLDGVLHRLR